MFQHIRFWSRLSGGAFLICGMLALAGCGGSDKIAVYPVTGVVLVKGKAAENAFLVFHPKEGGGPEAKRPFATTDSDGKFSVTTYDTGDGAPVGVYKVTIVWRNKPKSTMEADSPDKLNGKYSSPTAPQLPEVTVKSGTNTLEPIKID